MGIFAEFLARLRGLFSRLLFTYHQMTQPTQIGGYYCDFEEAEVFITTEYYDTPEEAIAAAEALNFINTYEEYVIAATDYAVDGFTCVLKHNPEYDVSEDGWYPIDGDVVGYVEVEWTDEQRKISSQKAEEMRQAWLQREEFNRKLQFINRRKQELLPPGQIPSLDLLNSINREYESLKA